MADADIERARDLAKYAKHDSVTPDRLAETGGKFDWLWLHDGPVYNWLDVAEQPHFLLHSKKGTPVFNGPAAPEPIERSRRHQVVHLITDSRWLMIAGNTTGDQIHEIQLSEITGTALGTDGRLTGLLSGNTFAFEIRNAHYQVPISTDFDDEDLVALSEYLRDGFGAIRGGTDVNPDDAGYTIAGADAIQYDEKDLRSRIDRLPDSAHEDADELLSQSASVEELIPRLDELLADHREEERTLNEVVDDASSIADLRREIETSSERTARQTKEQAGIYISEAREALRDADPSEVGDWGLNVGRASLPLAIAAPGSTPLWIAATLVLGGAAGTHASAFEDSPLTDIDPAELSAHVMAMSESGRELDEIDGEVAGALLGAFTYLGGRMAPEAFARWFDAADADAVLAGANAGAAYGQRDDIDGRRVEGMFAGAGLGLLSGFAGLDDHQFQHGEGIDGEELQQYFEQLADTGIESDTEETDYDYHD